MTPARSKTGRKRGGARALWGVLLTVGLVVAGATPAMAHARLLNSRPAAGSTYPSSPGQVRLAFTEVVEPGQSQVQVVGPDGHPVQGTRTIRDPQDARVLLTRLPLRLRPGTYAVVWRVLSVDGHPVAATQRFAVGAASSSLTTRTSVGSGPTLLGGTGRALDDVGLLALVGLLCFPLLLPRGRGGLGRPGPEAQGALGARLEPGMLGRLRLPIALAMGTALIGNLVLAVDTTAQSRGFSAGRVGRHLPELLRLLRDSRTGRLLAVREVGLLLLAGLLVAAYRLRGPTRPLRPRVAGLHTAGAAVLLLTVSISSHAGSSSVDTWLATGLDWTHLLAAGAWTGGLLALALAGLPAAQALGRVDPAGAAEQAGALTARFSDLAQLSMLVVLATGTYQALVHVSGVSELGRTAWGGELVAKLALWLTVVLVASAGTVSLVPRISRGASAASARLAACGELAGVMRFELAAALALVAVAAVLAGTAPPDQLL